MDKKIIELLEILRDEDNCNVLDYIDEAADLIESLAAELEQVKQERDGLNILLCQAQSMLEARTHERDVAVEDLRTKAYYCETCAHYTPGYLCPGCRNKSNWQWRGVMKNGGI